VHYSKSTEIHAATSIANLHKANDYIENTVDLTSGRINRENAEKAGTAFHDRMTIHSRRRSWRNRSCDKSSTRHGDDTL